MKQAVEALCHHCIADPFLAEAVKTEGERRLCVGCGRRRLALPLRDLAYRIDGAITDNYVVNRTDEGVGYADLVSDVAGVSADVGERIQALLSAAQAFDFARDGEDNLFEATFDEAPLDRHPQHSRWQDFKASVRAEARFFNRQAEQWLDEIFADIETHADWRGEPVVRTILPEEPAATFVRGRVAFDEAELRAFVSRPERELGPPPRGMASSGRMNAAGVAVFYGAEELATCRAEIRPPVGSHAVFARFSMLRPVRLLDFDVLAAIAVTGSIFDPDYIRRCDRVAFLRTFGAEISQPVMPRDEAFGYLPTQIVADYIAQRLGFDGLFYRSTQAGRAKRNVVLFNHSARVEFIDRSGIDTEVDLGWWDEDEHNGDDSISIRDEERAPEGADEPHVAAGPEPDLAEIRALEADLDDPRPVTLQLVPDSVEVQKIEATDYTPAIRSVRRSRHAHDPRDPLDALDDLPF
jgi:hypothetical protein